MRILITGSRYANQEHIKKGAELIYSCVPKDQNHTIVNGGAKGFDQVANYLAQHYPNFTSETHPANWNAHGKAAGPIRNQQMVDSGADVCFAFFIEGVESRGTSHCLRATVKASIPVHVFSFEP